MEKVTQRPAAESVSTGSIGSEPRAIRDGEARLSQSLPTPPPETVHEPSRLERAVHWGTKGGLALLDQGLFAGSNFLASVLLARWLVPAEYGAFALAYSIAFLFSSFYQSLLVEPMMVFGSGKYAEQFDRYLGILLRVHLTLMLPLSLLLAGAAFILGRVYSAGVQAAFLALAVAVPFNLLRGLLRGTFYIRSRPGGAAVGSIAYFVTVAVSLYFLQTSGHLSPPSALLAIAVASLSSSVCMAVRRRPRVGGGSGEPTMATVARDHWSYGRWSLASAGVTWLPQDIYYSVLPFWMGLSEVGALKALANLSAPVTNSISVLTMLLLPRLIHDRQHGGPPQMIRSMKFSLALFLSGSAVYLLFLWTFRFTILEFLYAGRYEEYADWLILVGLVPAVSCVAVVTATSLRAFERPDQIYWCDVAAGVISLLIGLPLAWALGVPGALIGKLTAIAGAVVFMLYFSRQHFYRQAAHSG